MLTLLIISWIFILISQYTIIYTLVLNQSITKKELIVGIIPIVGAIIGIFIFLGIIFTNVRMSYDIFKSSLKKLE